MVINYLELGFVFSCMELMLVGKMQRDYLKWRGTLFHRFLLALVDESEKIRQLADFLFGSILKSIDDFISGSLLTQYGFHDH